jgi:flagellar biosynthesis protein FlhF
MGPAADGQTTTVVKLAAREQQGGRRVAIIGTDTCRDGGERQLETYGRVCSACRSHRRAPERARRALKAARDADLVLIDTARAAGRAELWS